MAIDLTDGGSDHVGYGDIATDGLTAITVAVTVRLTDAAVTGRAVATKANNSFPDIAYTLQIRDTDELGFAVVGSGGSPASLAMQTTGLNLASGSLYRIMAWWDAALDDIEIWVNGVLEADAVWLGTPGPTAMRVTNAPARVGSAFGASLALGVECSELAIWNHVVPQRVREAYGKGMSPRFYRNGGILYAPVVNTDQLRDQWGGVLGVNTGGTNAPHPRVYYPAPSPLTMGHAPPPHISPPHIDDGTVALKAVDAASVSIGAEDDSVSIREKETATV